MKTTEVLGLALVVMTAVIGCRQKQPEPIPAPKAGLALAAARHFRPAAIAWFQGNLEEAFAPVHGANLRADARLGVRNDGDSDADGRMDPATPGNQPAAHAAEDQPHPPGITQTCPNAREHS
jgi:hypothetical protein